MITENEARYILEKKGFFVENLWSTEDVKSIYDCDDNVALEILNKTLTNDRIFNEIWETMKIIIEDIKENKNKKI